MLRIKGMRKMKHKTLDKDKLYDKSCLRFSLALLSHETNVPHGIYPILCCDTVV